jgi:beta-lactamase regulating signal transducer with metallopeptidase domain
MRWPDCSRFLCCSRSSLAFTSKISAIRNLPVGGALSSGPANRTNAETAPARTTDTRSFAADAGIDVWWWVCAVWVTGAALTLVVTMAAAIAVRVTSRPRPVTDADLLARVDECSSIVIPERMPRLMVGSRIGTPMVWGYWRPVIVLPPEALDWPEARQRMILLHELAHIRRGDHWVQLLIAVSWTCYWFHPAVWVAAARLAHEREMACDDVVLALGAEPHAYARELVLLARALKPRRSSVVGVLKMARGSLSHRVVRILDPHQLRATATRRGRTAIAMLMGCFLAAAASLTPVWGIEPARLTDRISPPSARVIEPDASQDVRWSGAPPRGSLIEIKAGRGSVIAEGTDDNSAQLVVKRHGSETSLRRLRIELIETAAGATFCAIHPPTRLMGTGPIVENVCTPGDWEHLNVGEDDDATTDFYVKVPASIRLRVWTGSAHVTLRNLDSPLQAGSVSGNIRVEGYAGPETVLRSMTGSIEFAGRVPPGSVHRLTSARGTLVWRTPSINDVQVSVGAPAGHFNTDFTELAAPSAQRNTGTTRPAQRARFELTSRFGAVRVIRTP